MRLLLALAAMLLLATFAPPALFVGPDLPRHSRIVFQTVPLQEGEPARRQVGKLLFLGGWAMRSNDPRFGGISTMRVAGGEVTALSDAGWLFSFSLPRPGAAPLTVVSPGGGSGGGEKGDRDSEALAVHGETAWIALEGANEVERYGVRRWTREAVARPAAMKNWPGNGGAEAMLRLRDGRFVLFSESRFRPDGSTEALLFDGDPTEPGTAVRAFGYAAPNHYRITDAALLPDGRMLLLHRRVGLANGVSAKLAIAETAGIGDAAILRSLEIAHLEPPLTVDNMEALSVTQEGGRTIVWIASDDNYIPLQRNLLLKFALVE